ncbi:YggT family protein [Alteriqipengyuania sp. WL0013]|nr:MULTISPECIES: YggT family protein [Alteriqipengyuania]MEB3416037.1 YggT family protein [Alteriqipengyuania sp. WL0013]WJY19311.1 YggT family protein [Alteriqipengyuania flavescens]WJY25252.1 YggT family protein [Alteriqipengyuania flavescens]
MTQILIALYNIMDLLTTVFLVLIIAQFIIGLLFSFNVLNPSNQFFSNFYTSINRLLEPILRPIRRIMPDTGMIDFSPLVVIVLLNVIMIVLGGMVNASI